MLKGESILLLSKKHFSYIIPPVSPMQTCSKLSIGGLVVFLLPFSKADIWFIYTLCFKDQILKYLLHNKLNYTAFPNLKQGNPENKTTHMSCASFCFQGFRFPNPDPGHRAVTPLPSASPCLSNQPCTSPAYPPRRRWRCQ